MVGILLQKITRRKIQIVLGSLWLLDGVLQLQHQMFTANFVHAVIAPAAQGQPQFVSGVMHFWIRIFLHQPVLCNLLIALIQLGLGILILCRRTARFGLLSSAIWGLFVWYVGEGLGGLFTGRASLIMGAPGAAILYVIIALGVLPLSSDHHDNDYPASWLAVVWAVVWLGGATLQLQSGQNTAASLSSMLIGMSDGGMPGWLGAMYIHVGHLVQDAGNLGIVALIAVQACIGLCIFLPRWFRITAVSLGIALSILFWAVGQSFGSYYSGLATDPNTAPLIILLGIAVLSASDMVKLTLFSS